MDWVVTTAVVVCPGREVVKRMEVVRSKVIVDAGKTAVKVLNCSCVETTVVGTIETWLDMT